MDKRSKSGRTTMMLLKALSYAGDEPLIWLEFSNRSIAKRAKWWFEKLALFSNLKPLVDSEKSICVFNTTYWFSPVPGSAPSPSQERARIFKDHSVFEMKKPTPPPIEGIMESAESTANNKLGWHDCPGNPINIANLKDIKIRKYPAMVCSMCMGHGEDFDPRELIKHLRKKEADRLQAMISAPSIDRMADGMSMKWIILAGVISACFGVGLFSLCVWIAKMIWNSQ